MNWDAEDYCASLSRKPRGYNLAREDELLEIFKPFATVQEVTSNQLPLLESPGVVVDSDDRVLLCALPGLLTGERQVCDLAFLIFCDIEYADDLCS